LSAEILIRPFSETDRAFVIDSAWRSICEHPAVGRDVAPVIRRLFPSLLDDWRTIVAADVDRPHVIYSWLCLRDPDLLAWGFTVPGQRKKGAMRALAVEAGLAREFTTLFPIKRRLANYKPRWRPYLVLGSDHAAQSK
jgi:hypothetical protein